MTDEIDSVPSSDERLIAALAHFFGMLGALIIWAMQKDKSRFVRFQAAQALAFDLLVMAVMFVLVFCLMGVMFVGMFGTIFAVANSNTSPQSVSPFMLFPVLFPFLMFTCILPFSLVLFVARIVATISVLSGNNFRYPFLGQRVEKFLAE